MLLIDCDRRRRGQFECEEHFGAAGSDIENPIAAGDGTDDL